MDPFDQLEYLPDKPAVGRPTDYSAELCAQICELVADGRSLRWISRQPGMPARTTIIRWLKDDDKLEFRTQYEAAYKIQLLVVEDELKDLIDECDVAEIAKAREQVKIRQWLLKINEPKKFGDRPEPAAAQESDIDFSTWSDEDRDAFIALHEKNAKPGNATE